MIRNTEFSNSVNTDQSPGLFLKKSFLKIFGKATGLLACWGSVSAKVTGQQPASLLKSESPAQVFFCEFCKIFMSHLSTKQILHDVISTCMLELNLICLNLRERSIVIIIIRSTS